MNLDFAKRAWSKRTEHPQRLTIEKLVAVSEKRLHDGSETLSEAVCSSPCHFSQVLVERLAEILAAAGPRVISVLSSTWQAPRNKGRLETLEKALAEKLGRDFGFDAVTGSPDKPNSSMADKRLQAIADFMRRASMPGGVAASTARRRRLRVLVLEDFFIKPLKGSWACGGRAMSSAAAVEEYIKGHMPSSSGAVVKLIHTYSEWTTADGISLQCGVGLTAEQVRAAKAFLAGTPTVAVGDDLPAEAPSSHEAPTHFAGYPQPFWAMSALVEPARLLRVSDATKRLVHLDLDDAHRLTFDNVNASNHQPDKASSNRTTGTPASGSTRTSSLDSSPDVNTPRSSEEQRLAGVQGKQPPSPQGPGPGKKTPPSPQVMGGGQGKPPKSPQAGCLKPQVGCPAGASEEPAPSSEARPSSRVRSL